MAVTRPSLNSCCHCQILLTPEGPALCMPSTQPAPTNVLLSSLVNALAAAPTLVLLLDAISVRVDEAASQCARSNPHAHILPPLLHPNMAAVGGMSTERLQVGERSGGGAGDDWVGGDMRMGGDECGGRQVTDGRCLVLQVVGSRCSAFSAVVAREILHGVSVQQLHRRTNLQLATVPRSSASSPPSPAVLLSNFTHDWLF